MSKNKEKPLSFHDPLFSELCKFAWPYYYHKDYDDYNTAFRFLFLFKTKERFFEHFTISETLINYTSEWSYSELVGSLIYFYIVWKLKNEKSELTEFDWEIIFNFVLNPSCSPIVLEVLERNRFINYSKKESILAAARQTLFRFGGRLHLVENLEEQSLTLVRFLQFLQVSEKEAKVLVEPVFIKKNVKDIVKFLTTHRLLDR